VSVPEGAPIARLTLAVRAPELDDAPVSQGLLVAPAPADEQPVAAKALSHLNVKWPWLADQLPPHTHLLRLSYGRLGEAEPAAYTRSREPLDKAGAYGIQGKLVSVREHNEQQMADKIINHLSDDLTVAQVSDAGTPAVCDPGAKLAARVREAGFKVVPVVGASAVMGALSVAGVTESDFYFNGFLPPKAGERQKLLAKWAEADFPIVMFETPHRIEASLADMAAQFPERRLTLAREITKTFETFLSGTVAEIQAALKNDGNQTRGEMVLVLHPAVKEKHSDLPEAAQNTMKILAAELPTKQAAELAAKITGESKKTLYDLALEWKRISDDA